MSPDSSTTPRADGDGTGPVPAKAAASLRGRAVLVVGCRGRMGAMLCRRGKAGAEQAECQQQGERAAERGFTHSYTA